jgi:hypothetical protein
MPEPSTFLQMTPRRRRIRQAVLGLLIIILAMIVLGLLHPFFDVRRHGPLLTDVARKAHAVKAMMIMFYWAGCMSLAVAMAFLAYLELREVRLQLLMAQRDIWKDAAERAREQTTRKKNGS